MPKREPTRDTDKLTRNSTDSNNSKDSMDIFIYIYFFVVQR